MTNREQTAPTSRQETSAPVKFQGFGEPGFTQIPNCFLDTGMQELTEAELRVMLYIMRHTFGYNKLHRADAISYSQFLEGVRTSEGRQIDNGCGVKNRTNLAKALKSLAEKEYIFAYKIKAAEGDQATTVYEINVDGQPHYNPHPCQGGSTEKVLGVVPKKHQGGSTEKVPTIENTLQYKTHNTAPALCVLPDNSGKAELDKVAVLENELRSICNLSRSKASQLARTAAANGHGPGYPARVLAYAQSHPNVKNLPGFISNAITEDWTLTPARQEQADQEQATQEQAERIKKLQAKLDQAQQQNDHADIDRYTDLLNKARSKQNATA